VMKRYDTNKDGVLDNDELREFLSNSLTGHTYDEELIQQFTEVLDINQDGSVSLPELRLFTRCYPALSMSASVGPIISKSALLVIDVQNDFISGSLNIKNCPAGHDGEEVVPVVNQMRDSFDTVIFSQDWHPSEHCSFVENVNAGIVPLASPVSNGEHGPFEVVRLAENEEFPSHEQILWPRHCVQNEIGSELHPQLEVGAEDHFVHKGKNARVDSYSAFYDNGPEEWRQSTGLYELLEKLQVTDVFCCGIATDVCVAYSALHSAEMGFRTFLVEDACRGVNAEDIEIRKEQLRDAGVQVINSDKAMELGKAQQQLTLQALLAHARKASNSTAIHRASVGASHTSNQPLKLERTDSGRRILQLNSFTSDEQRAYLRTLFNISDRDRSGQLERKELATLLSFTGFRFDVKTVEELIDECDVNGDGIIAFDEFVMMMKEHAHILDPVRAIDADAHDSPTVQPGREELDLSSFSEEQLQEYLQKLFMVGDRDKNGTLDREELGRLLEWSGFKFEFKSVDSMLERCDLNGDGVIQFSEFAEMMKMYCHVMKVERVHSKSESERA